MHSIQISTISREINSGKNKITADLKKNTRAHDGGSPEILVDDN